MGCLVCTVGVKAGKVHHFNIKVVNISVCEICPLSIIAGQQFTTGTVQNFKWWGNGETPAKEIEKAKVG